MCVYISVHIYIYMYVIYIIYTQIHRHTNRDIDIDADISKTCNWMWPSGLPEALSLAWEVPLVFKRLRVLLSAWALPLTTKTIMSAGSCYAALYKNYS